MHDQPYDQERYTIVVPPTGHYKITVVTKEEKILMEDGTISPISSNRTLHVPVINESG